MFKKINIIIAVFVFGLCLTANASSTDSRKVHTVHDSSKSSTISVPTTTSSVYSHSFPIHSANSPVNIGVMYKASPATADVAVYFEQSFRKPSTEGASDSAYIVTDTINASLTDANWHLATIDTVEMTYGRFKIDGQNSSPATTTIQIKVVK